MGRLGRLARLPGGDAGGIDAAHLPGADTDRGAVLHVDDGVRLDVLADREGEQQVGGLAFVGRSEEHTSELQSLLRISYAVFCLKKKKKSHNATLLHIISFYNTPI